MCLSVRAVPRSRGYSPNRIKRSTSDGEDKEEERAREEGRIIGFELNLKWFEDAVKRYEDKQDRSNVYMRHRRIGNLRG